MHKNCCVTKPGHSFLLTMEDNKRPYLIPSTTEDDDSAVTHVKDESFVDRRAIAYLLRYETMVRQQEAEHMATLAHLRPLLESLSEHQVMSTMVDQDMDLEKEISFQQLQDSLNTIEKSPHSYMKTDLQLMMVLKTMTLKIPEEDHGSITWAEFLQCYKTVIAGMQTLRHVQETGKRARTKDRTLSMISLFEPPATKLLDALPRDIHVSAFDDENISNRKQRLPGVLARQKKFAYLVIGALGGAAFVFASGAYMKPELMAELTGTAPRVVNPATTFAAPNTPAECESVVVIEEMKTPVVAQPVRPAIPEKKPPPVHYVDAGKTLEEKFKASAAETKKLKTHTTVSVTVGGVAGMLVAPVVWNAVQKLPALVAGIPGWGVAFFTGSVLVQGLIQALVMRFRKKD